jgi:hypothetical protein
MGTPEAGNTVKLEDTNGNSEGWQMWSTRNEPLTYEGSRNTEVALAQSNLSFIRGLK